MSNSWLRKVSTPNESGVFADTVLITLLVVHVALLSFAAVSKSPANHEVAQLPAGLSHWKFKRFELGAVNPPLVRLVAAAPVCLMQPEMTWRRVYHRTDLHSEYAACRDFMRQNGERAIVFFLAGRIACIPFSLIGACICYRWAFEVSGRTAGRFATSLWCFSPSILGEGSLITSDVPSAAFGLLTMYQFSHYLSRSCWANASMLGIAIGLAISTKFTWFAVLPIIFTPFIAYRLICKSSLRQSALVIGHFGFAFLIAILVLNMAYGLVQSPTQLGDVEFVSKTFTRLESDPHSSVPVKVNRFRGTFLGELFVPLPSAVLEGIDVQKRDFELVFPSFLMGEWKQGGWFYYYVVAICVKSPVAFLLLAAIGTCVNLKSARRSAGSAVMLFAPLVILVFVSSQLGLNQHMRYILPALPFGYVVASSIMTLGPYWKKLAWALLACQIVSVIWYAPHWTSYFNILAGGPESGPKWLLHSNVDTGQDLLLLKRWQRDQLGAERLYFAPNSFYDPGDIGIEFELPPPFIAGRPEITNEKGLRGPQPGWNAVSVAQLNGQNIATPDGRGGWGESDGHYTYFKYFRPVGKCGYSIYLFHITREQAESARQQLRDSEVTITN